MKEITSAQRKEYLARLTALSQEMGIYIDACGGCCHSPYLLAINKPHVYVPCKHESDAKEIDLVEAPQC